MRSRRTVSDSSGIPAPLLAREIFGPLGGIVQLDGVIATETCELAGIALGRIRTVPSRRPHEIPAVGREIGVFPTATLPVLDVWRGHALSPGRHL
jgi:hypothetical protein